MTTAPIFTVYVIWHPSYGEGRQIADLLRIHFSRNIYRGVQKERAISVLERSQPVPGAHVPLPVDWDESEFIAVVVLAEANLIEDHKWNYYVREIAETAHRQGLPAGFFPVTMDSRGIDLKFKQQCLRWDLWNVSDVERSQQLTSNLTHEFCRMLRHNLNQPGERDDALGCYLDKIRVFISHSKHDDDGEFVGSEIREWIHKHSPLDSFFDVYDIPAGLSFEDVLLHEIGSSVLLAIHSDSYSSRDWCRREIVEAKRRMIPMVVVDCMRDVDPRTMPYLGNVPCVRMDPDRMDRIGTISGCLVDEVFRSWLWLCRVLPYSENSPGVLFTPQPPELITLAMVPSCDEDTVPTIVYPEPLLLAEEEQLFRKIAPRVRMQTLTDWLEQYR